jgi:hypothetical protein
LGDGITSAEVAHLDGGRKIWYWMGVWHSPRSPGKWYDSPDVLLAWIGYLLETNREDAKDTKEEAEEENTRGGFC